MAGEPVLTFKCPDCGETYALATGQLVWEAHSELPSGRHVNASNRIIVDFPMVILCGDCVLKLVAARSGVDA